MAIGLFIFTDLMIFLQINKTANINIYTACSKEVTQPCSRFKGNQSSRHGIRKVMSIFMWHRLCLEELQLTGVHASRVTRVGDLYQVAGIYELSCLLTISNTYAHVPIQPGDRQTGKRMDSGGNMVPVYSLCTEP